MYIPLSYWGPKVCPNYLETGSLLIYYNALIPASYPGLPGAPGPISGSYIYNLVNTASWTATLQSGPGAYSPTFQAIDNRLNVSNVPWNLYDGSPSTILIRGIFTVPPAGDTFLLQGSNSNEGLHYYSSTGAYGFSRGVYDCQNTMNFVTGMNSAQNAFTTLAVVRESSPTAKLYLTSDKSNFGQQFTQSLGTCTIINETDFFTTNSYIQSVAFYQKQLTQIELISASQAMECGAYPQGYSEPKGWPSGSSTTYPTVEYLLLGGGGGGGFGVTNSSPGAGGGGGGFISGSLTLSTGSSYPITIGAGGTRGMPTSTGSLNGGNTTAFTLTAFGGGYGGSQSGSIINGGDGGCGGGSAMPSSYNATGSQGGRGGGSAVTNPAAVGGGGGAGGDGDSASFRQSGGGGNGKAWKELTPVYYGAGGGGGGAPGSPGTGRGSAGQGGTGFGGDGTNDGFDGTANKGDGGGGGYQNSTSNQPGGNGGSGLVAIRYNGTPQFYEGTIVTTQLYEGQTTTHYFTSSFTLTI
jgi:hypothetical protein